MENANGLGRRLSRQLLAAGESVVDVPVKLSARVRALSGAGHKTDSHDARPTAVAGRTGTGVKPMTVDDPLLALLDVVLERRWQLVTARQQTLCRIHDQLTAWSLEAPPSGCQRTRPPRCCAASTPPTRSASAGG